MKTIIIVIITLCTFAFAQLNEDIRDDSGKLIISGDAVSHFILANYSTNFTNLTYVAFASDKHPTSQISYETSNNNGYTDCYFVIDYISGIKRAVGGAGSNPIYEDLNNTFIIINIDHVVLYSGLDTSIIRYISYNIPSYYNNVDDGVYNESIPLNVFYTKGLSKKLCADPVNCRSVNEIITVIANESFKSNTFGKTYCPLVSIWPAGGTQYNERHKHTELACSLTKFIKRDTNNVYYEINNDSTKEAKIGLIDGSVVLVAKPNAVLNYSKKTNFNNTVKILNNNNSITINSTKYIQEIQLFNLQGQSLEKLNLTTKNIKSYSFYKPIIYSIGHYILNIKSSNAFNSFLISFTE
jgi:hypothetical protein